MNSKSKSFRKAQGFNFCGDEFVRSQDVRSSLCNFKIETDKKGGKNKHKTLS